MREIEGRYLRDQRWTGIIYRTTARAERGVVYRIRTTKKEQLPQIRPIAGLEAIDEAIGRATELGRPIHYSLGYGSLTADTAPQTLAGVAVLADVARRVSAQKTELLVTVMQADVFPLAEETVRQAYVETGSIESYRADFVQFISPEQFAYAIGAMGLMQRKQVAANLMIGPFMAESLLLSEVGSALGAIQVGGTATTHQIPFFVAACDYTLLGDELFAAGAYLSEDPVGLGSIVGQDVGKAIAVVLIALVLASTAGSDFNGANETIAARR